MSVKGTTTKADYINFDTATNKANKLLQSKKERLLGLYIIISINSGLRASDVLCLNWEDFNNDVLLVTETKTNKKRTIAINDNIKSALERFNKKEGKIFKSQKGSVISIQQINRKLKRVFNQENKTKNISTHSLRKTFGRRVYENNNESEKALIYLSELFSHSSPSITRIYLGIRQEELNDIYFNL